MVKEKDDLQVYKSKLMDYQRDCERKMCEAHLYAAQLSVEKDAFNALKKTYENKESEGWITAAKAKLDKVIEERSLIFSAIKRKKTLEKDN